MHCSKYKTLIHKHLDGRASQREAAELQKHLEICPACRRRQEEDEALMEMLRVPPVKAPSDLSAAINRRIQSRERQSAPPRRALTTGLILGSSFVAAGCLVLLFSLLGVDFLSLPANIHEHMTLLFSNLSVSLDSLFSSLSNLSSLFPSL